MKRHNEVDNFLRVFERKKKNDFNKKVIFVRM